MLRIFRCRPLAFNCPPNTQAEFLSSFSRLVPMAARLRSVACGRSSTQPRHSHNKDVYCFDHYSLLKEREGKGFRFKSNNRTQVLVRRLMSWHILTPEYSKWYYTPLYCSCLAVFFRCVQCTLCVLIQREFYCQRCVCCSMFLIRCAVWESMMCNDILKSR